MCQRLPNQYLQIHNEIIHCFTSNSKEHKICLTMEQWYYITMICMLEWHHWHSSVTCQQKYSMQWFYCTIWPHIFSKSVMFEQKIQLDSQANFCTIRPQVNHADKKCWKILPTFLQVWRNQGQTKRIFSLTMTEHQDLHILGSNESVNGRSKRSQEEFSQ